jgi:hypothetical protein
MVKCPICGAVLDDNFFACGACGWSAGMIRTMGTWRDPQYLFMASLMARRAERNAYVFDHNVLSIAATRESDALRLAEVYAIRKFPISEGWSRHAVKVSPVLINNRPVIYPASPWATAAILGDDPDNRY